MTCIDKGEKPTLSNRSAPVLLTHICSELRQIALRTPLWSNLHVWGSKTGQFEGAKEWLLRRSGTLPLGLAFGYVDIGHELVDTCSRWKDLTLSAFVPCIANLNGSDLPLLRSISLQQHHSMRSDRLLSSTALTSLHFLAIADLSPYLRAVNWANLKHLTIHGSIFWDFTGNSRIIISSILRQTPRLVSCDINTVNSDMPLKDTTYISEISLPDLKTLTMTECISPKLDNIEGIFGSINAPSLERVIYNRTSTNGRISVCTRQPLANLVYRSTDIKQITAWMDTLITLDH